MATSKSSAHARRVQTDPKKARVQSSTEDQTNNEPESVLVPVLSSPYRKAPEVDPYLKPESVTAEQLTICGYALPPILRGVQPCSGQDYNVEVIWMSRRQIETLMACVREQYPELSQMLSIMKAFMGNLDTLRDEAKLGILAARSWIKPDTPEGVRYRENLEAAAQNLGRWNDENRLFLH